ncbi:phytanoyl-CoA dioxygenase family protein [Candidatus Sumerlaeota bacterium]|nr:phytanoyl-CoA dioxygenase family protein [Candidatus Sumerlaeota bacterium]
MAVLSKIKSLLKKEEKAPEPKLRTWSNDPKLLPWTDQPDAEQEVERRLAAGKLTPRDAELARKWIKDGYIVLQQHFVGSDVDKLNGEIDALWTAEKPHDGLNFHDVIQEDGAPATLTISHRDLLAIPAEEREKARLRGKWRIHGFHFHSKTSMNIFKDESMRKTVSMLLGTETQPQYTINFHWGSQHGLHQDLMVFHVHPANYLVGAWIALEDISPDCGPLVYSPGSHRMQMYHEYDNYPQTNLRTSDQERRKRYEAHLAEEGSKFERHQFIAKKGDVLLWHAMLLHGGDTIKNKALTRRSMVIHYMPPEMDKSKEVVGPFMW